MLIIFNWLGVAFVGIGIGLSTAASFVFGIHSEGGLMMILGPAVLVSDLSYRLFHKNGHWFWPSRGGNLFFLPAWMFGMLWLVLGGVYLYRGDAGNGQSNNARNSSISQVIGQLRLHPGGNSDRLVQLAKVVGHREQRERVHVVFDFLAERIGEASEAAIHHANREI